MYLTGLHHITAVSANITDNMRFYTEVLGLRLVKKSVNQDDVSAYHLFYADKKGTPGTDLTFFDWPRIGDHLRGTDSIAGTAFRVSSREALDYWRKRFEQLNVSQTSIQVFAGREILPFEDHETANFLAKSFKSRKITVMTETKAVSLEKNQNKVIVTLEGKDKKQKQIETEKVLCVFGRTPNTDNIGLENIGLTTEKGYIPVNDFGQTSVKGVYAIGDVVSTPALAHVASKEGEIAVSHIAGEETIEAIERHLRFRYAPSRDEESPSDALHVNDPHA